MLISIHIGFIRYKSLVHDQIRASYWAIWLMNINDFLNVVHEAAVCSCSIFQPSKEIYNLGQTSLGHH